MKNTEGVPHGRGLEAPESVRLPLHFTLANANIVTCKSATSYDPIVIGTDLKRIRSEGETDLQRTLLKHSQKAVSL